jgi:hypothetical protein
MAGALVASPGLPAARCAEGDRDGGRYGDGDHRLGKGREQGGADHHKYRPEHYRPVESAIRCCVCSRGGLVCYGLLLRFAPALWQCHHRIHGRG